MSDSRHRFMEFFAGGGMARLGLGPSWKCVFSNEWSEKKAACYRANFAGGAELRIGDVREIDPKSLPRDAALAWASFPCQDLSLAGNGLGLAGERSGTFWSFWDLISTLEDDRHPVPIIALENVTGLLTSQNGADLQELLRTLARSGYAYGAMIVDGVHFVPQSRPRLFIVAVRATALDAIPTHLKGSPHPRWHSDRMRQFVFSLPRTLRANWIWWRLPEPPAMKDSFASVIEPEPAGVKWHTRQETERLLAMMSAVNLQKVENAKRTGCLQVGAIYKRTRINESGAKVQRAEVRFDNISGCLRTPAGGSSRQLVLIVEGMRVRSRLLSPREAARLMGLPDSYVLPDNYNEAYHLAGDGLVVPAVRWLSDHLLTPIADVLQPVEV
ncbi:MAG: Modification methylase HpaII [Planctomycetes bacterium]|nr:Modification methylase HpaII [Planctomycetota bacterium]